MPVSGRLDSLHHCDRTVGQFLRRSQGYVQLGRNARQANTGYSETHYRKVSRLGQISGRQRCDVTAVAALQVDVRSRSKSIKSSVQSRLFTRPLEEPWQKHIRHCKIMMELQCQLLNGRTRMDVQYQHECDEKNGTSTKKCLGNKVQLVVCMYFSKEGNWNCSGPRDLPC